MGIKNAETTTTTDTTGTTTTTKSPASSFNAILVMFILLTFSFIGGYLVSTLATKWINSGNFYHVGLKYTWAPDSRVNGKIYTSVNEYDIAKRFQLIYPDIPIMDTFHRLSPKKTDSCKVCKAIHSNYGVDYDNGLGFSEKDLNFINAIYNHDYLNCVSGANTKDEFEHYKKISDFSKSFAFSFFSLFVLLMLNTIYYVGRLLLSGSKPLVSTIVVMLLSLIIVSLCICLIDKDFVWKAWNSLPVIFILWFLVYIVIALLFIAVDKKINTFRLVIPYVFLLFTYGAYNISCRAWRYNNLIWTDYIFNSYRCKGPDYVQIFKITDTINNLYNKRPLPVDNSLKDSTITSKTDSTKSNKTLKGK